MKSKDLQLLEQAAQRGINYLTLARHREVYPTNETLQQLALFDFPLPEESTAPEQVITLLDEHGSPNTTTNVGGRYYGFVNGGALPVTVAAQWLATAWDQNAALQVMSPVAAQLESIAGQWLIDLFQLPKEAGVGFVTGATMANFAALAAARHTLLQKKGWNVEAKGLYGAPEIKVVVGDTVHISPLKALSLLGFGSERITRVPADEQGRMIPEGLPAVDDLTIILTQVGNVNSGASDPVGAICQKAQKRGAWVHVDGAFGLWAAAAPGYADQVTGLHLADSWAVDLHKWLNVPYDSGVAICKRANNLRAAMSVNAAYLVQGAAREPLGYTPEMSRRARGVEAYAALYHLGKKGVAGLIDRCCKHARSFAKQLSAAGFDILNEVVLNQVLVSFGDDQINEQVISGIQKDRTCWCGGTTWQGRRVMRISVSSWATTSEDVEKSVLAMIRVAKEVIDQNANLSAING